MSVKATRDTVGLYRDDDAPAILIDFVDETRQQNKLPIEIYVFSKSKELQQTFRMDKETLEEFMVQLSAKMIEKLS